MDRAGDHKYDLLIVMSTYMCVAWMAFPAIKTYFEKEENFVAKGDY
jgi:hypothetical protein